MPARGQRGVCTRDGAVRGVPEVRAVGPGEHSANGVEPVEQGPRQDHIIVDIEHAKNERRSEAHPCGESTKMGKNSGWSRRIARTEPVADAARWHGGLWLARRITVTTT